MDVSTLNPVKWRPGIGGPGMLAAGLAARILEHPDYTAIAGRAAAGIPAVPAGACADDANVEANVEVNVEPTVVDAARAVGMTETQVLLRVAAPIACR